MKRVLLPFALLCAQAAPAPAQVLETPEGPVEFIGLVHRTPEEVRDALAAARPEVSLHSAEAATDLREALGFAEAAVGTYVGFGLPEGYVTLTVVEPEEAGRVRYVEPPADSLGPIEAWAEAYALYPERRWAWSYAMAGVEAAPDLPDSTSVPAVRAFLDAHATEDDLQRALQVLEADRSPVNRAIAAAVLSRSPESEAAWHALVGAVRGTGPEDPARPMAVLALSAMAGRAPSRVDWAPAVDDLRAILDGTSVFAFPHVLQVLMRTLVAAELADKLLAGGGELLLDHLASTNRSLRTMALAFLLQVSDVDYGTDADGWRAWIGTL